MRLASALGALCLMASGCANASSEPQTAQAVESSPQAEPQAAPAVKSKPSPVVTKEVRALSVDAKEQWGEVGCIPRGPQLTLKGRYAIDPPREATGKRLRGEWLVTDAGDRWLLSYAGGRFHPELDGRAVLARGRQCDKEGQSVGASHFALNEISELAE